jgi:hypothetical protein
MKTISKIQASLLKTAIRESLKNYELKKENNSLKGLSLSYDNEENILFFYNDLEILLHEVRLPSGEELNYHTLRSVIQQLDQENFFDKNYISRPFAISLIDKQVAIIEEIFFLDDTVIQEEDIWPKMEKELDNFLKNLLA